MNFDMDELDAIAAEAAAEAEARAAEEQSAEYVPPVEVPVESEEITDQIEVVTPPEPPQPVPDNPLEERQPIDTKWRDYTKKLEGHVEKQRKLLEQDSRLLGDMKQELSLLQARIAELERLLDISERQREIAKNEESAAKAAIRRFRDGAEDEANSRAVRLAYACLANVGLSPEDARVTIKRVAADLGM